MSAGENNKLLETFNARPCAAVGTAKDGEYVSELIHNSFSAEQRTSKAELNQNTPSAPSVNPRTIVGCAKKEFWGSLPEGAALVTHVDVRRSEIACIAKVCKL